MPRDNKNSNQTQFTKRQASVINRGNRNISGNINSLMSELNSMTYGVQNTDKVDALSADFNSMLKAEIKDINTRADGDTASFITKLFSENNKRIASTVKDMEAIFNTNDGQLDAFLTEQYRNKMVKQADLHEVASQLTELQEAITITRDSIISADVVDGHMSRTLTVNTGGTDSDQEDYVPMIEAMEEKFKLQEKVKNFIIPKSLEYGEYYVYRIPYAKIFEDFSKEKNSYNGKYKAYGESEGKTLYESFTTEATNELCKSITESVESSTGMQDVLQEYKKNAKSIRKEVDKELKTYMENITVCNDPIPLCILEEGVDSYREYYTEFVEKTITEDNKSISFNKVMSGIDDGIHSFIQSGKNKNGKTEKYNDIKECYIKLTDPMKLLPIEIMDECIGYYYIQEEDISPLSGILTSTMYYDKFDNNRNENNALSTIAEAIVSAFDKKFLQKNMKFKKLIVEALNYYKLNNRKIRFQFIPKEYIHVFKPNSDEHGHGVSIIEPSLFYGKLYLMILLFKIMTIITSSNDMKVNYIKQSGIEKNVANKIQEIARQKQQRQITLTDMFSYTTLINKIGQGSEQYIPVGKSGERGIETEILQGQDVQLNNDLMEMLKKACIGGTGVPDVLLNYLHEAEFAKTIELANTRFQGRVVSYQLDYNKQITEFYKAVMRDCTTIPPEIIDSFEFSFVKPKYSNSNITNDLLNNHNSLQDFLVTLFFGQDGVDDPKNVPIVKYFKRRLAEERLPMINFNEINKLYKEACVNGTKELLDPNNQNSQEG